MSTLITFRRSPKSKLPRECVQLNCNMTEEQARDWIVNGCGYKKACEFQFGTHDALVKYEGGSAIECSPDWDGMAGF